MRNRILTVDPDEVYDMSLTEDEKLTLQRLARSEDDADRINFLDWVGCWSLRGRYGPLLIPLLEELAPHDPREDIGNRALMYLGDYTEWEPELTWQVLLRLMDNDDLFELLSAFILEHLLGHHAEEYFPRVRKRIEAGSRMWWLLLKGCYLFGQMEQREDEVVALLDTYAQGQ